MEDRSEIINRFSHRYRLAIPTRSVHWGIKWEAVDDSMLLVGVYQYGLDNWDAIKSDTSLGLSNRVCLFFFLNLAFITAAFKFLVHSNPSTILKTSMPRIDQPFST